MIDNTRRTASQGMLIAKYGACFYAQDENVWIRASK